MKDDPLDKIEILSQPLLTSEGSLNPACLNELKATLAETPKTYHRLRDEPEWSYKSWTFTNNIVGAFSMWACRQSPYCVPDGLENVCKYLHAALKTAVPWDAHGMAQLSLCDINRLLREILYEQGVAEFDAWNRCKAGDTPDISFSSAFDGTRNPDREFIDLDALLHNVCITIRDERRKSWHRQLVRALRTSSDLACGRG